MLSKFKIGMLVKCKQCDDLDYPFLGRVINILSSKLVVEILQFNYQDRYKVSLIQYNTVVETKNCVRVELIRVNSKHDSI